MLGLQRFASQKRGSVCRRSKAVFSSCLVSIHRSVEKHIYRTKLQVKASSVTGRWLENYIFAMSGAETEVNARMAPWCHRAGLMGAKTWIMERKGFSACPPGWLVLCFLALSNASWG